ncbi:hypothetical protein BJY04DRAFT_214103 [Aspergillus karnatakaensis]|uniref:uncharacterized protein n=1 Tax=Aspergillus karnatakaensis TaxID=1810916 RepID=UPI003CCD0959
MPRWIQDLVAYSVYSVDLITLGTKNTNAYAQTISPRPRRQQFQISSREFHITCPRARPLSDSPIQTNHNQAQRPNVNVDVPSSPPSPAHGGERDHHVSRRAQAQAQPQLQPGAEIQAQQTRPRPAAFTLKALTDLMRRGMPVIQSGTVDDAYEGEVLDVLWEGLRCLGEYDRERRERYEIEEEDSGSSDWMADEDEDEDAEAEVYRGGDREEEKDYVANMRTFALKLLAQRGKSAKERRWPVVRCLGISMFIIMGIWYFLRNYWDDEWESESESEGEDYDDGESDEEEASEADVTNYGDTDQGEDFGRLMYRRMGRYIMNGYHGRIRTARV